jgi:adenosylhomocysteine nucleosidase
MSGGANDVPRSPSLCPSFSPSLGSRILILFAVEQELRPMRRRRASLGDRDVWLAATGMGARNAAAAAAAMLDDDPRPDLVIIAGVAGALDPTLQVGDVVVADSLITDADLLIPPLVPAIRNPQSAIRNPYTGPLLSLDRVLITPEEKAAAFNSPPPNTQHPTPPEMRGLDSPLPPSPASLRAAGEGGPGGLGPLAVEMESAAVAREAARRSIPWSAVRAISDTAADSLPLDFNRLRDHTGGLPVSRVALAALTHPAAIPGLIRLGKNTTFAAERLAEYLCTWLTAQPQR